MYRKDGTHMHYRRHYLPGGCYFFTVVTHQRKPVLTEQPTINVLRDAFKWVQKRHPLRINAIVILPDHLHCIWTLPKTDHDFSTRWRLIKGMVTKHGQINTPIWQKRFWEHTLRDEHDLQAHTDYIYYNPVKHGYVLQTADWPYSSFHRDVARGRYPIDWGGNPLLPDNTGNE